MFVLTTCWVLGLQQISFLLLQPTSDAFTDWCSSHNEPMSQKRAYKTDCFEEIGSTAVQPG